MEPGNYGQECSDVAGAVPLLPMLRPAEEAREFRHEQLEGELLGVARVRVRARLHPAHRRDTLHAPDL